MSLGRKSIQPCSECCLSFSCVLASCSTLHTASTIPLFESEWRVAQQTTSTRDFQLCHRYFKQHIQSNTKGNNTSNWCLNTGIILLHLLFLWYSFFKRVVRSRQPHIYLDLTFSEILSKLVFISDLYNWKRLKQSLEDCLHLRHIRLNLLFICLKYHRQRKGMISMWSS